MTARSTIALVVVSALTFGNAFAAFERLPAGARSQGLCGASQLALSDPFVLETNPAAIGVMGINRITISTSPGLFGMNELRRTEAALAFEFLGGTTGVLGRSFGFALYREITLVGGFAAQVSPELTVGASLAWYALHVSGYGDAGTIGVNLGASVRLADQIRYGLSIRNVNRPRIGRSRESVPTELLTCIEFQPVPSFLLSAALTKDPDSPLCGSFGAEWIIEGHVVLRAGAQEGLQLFGTGGGVIFGPLSVDYGLSIHPDLGFTHHFSVSLEFP